MKNTILKSSHKPCNAAMPPHLESIRGGGRADDGGHRSAMRETRQRYCVMALTMAIVAGGTLMLLGYPALGKGLILGALFSILNFFIMAAVLPLRLGKGRGKSFLFTIGSIFLRYVFMTLPLVVAFKQETYAFSTAALGLFMVQLAILGDHLLARWRHPVEAG